MADFFDKMVVGFSKGVNSMKESSRIMVEKANLNTSIKENEAKKKQILLQLGTLAYDLQVQGIINVEGFTEIVNAAMECDTEMAKMKERLRALEAEKTAAPASATAAPSASMMHDEPIVEEIPATDYEMPAVQGNSNQGNFSQQNSNQQNSNQQNSNQQNFSQQSVMCNNCNSENRAGSRFCVKCGTPLA